MNHIVNFPTEKKFWKNLERARKTLGWSHGDMAESLSLTSKEYVSMIGRRETPNAFSLFRLAERLGMDFERLALGDIDFVALEKQFYGDHLYIPERYRPAAFSKRRTSLPIFEFIDTFMGEELLDSMLKKLQVRRAAFTDPDSMINIHFPTDLCNLLQSHGIPNETIESAGKYSVVTNANTSIGRSTAACRSLKEAYEFHVSQMMNLYERNCVYRIHRISEHLCVVDCFENEDVRDSLKVKHLGSAAACLFKNGVAAAVPGFLGLPMGKTTETRCIHRNDPFCRFEIEFQNVRPRENARHAGLSLVR